MMDNPKYYLAYGALLLAGILLYGVGNLALGKRRQGGKRLVILIAGLFMIGMAGVVGWCVVSLWSDAKSWKGCVGAGLLALLGAAGVGGGVHFLFLAFSQNMKKVDKTFDSITDAF